LNIKREKIGEKIKLTIEVEAEILKKASDEAYKKMANQVKIDGFRPGKAPRHIVEKEIGQERLDAEILDKVIPETYYQAVIQEKLNPIGQPEVKMIKFVPTDGLTYEAVVELMPEIKLPDITKVKVKSSVPKVTTEEIEAVLEDLSKQLAKYSRVARAAKAGDQIVIDYDGFVDGLAFEGGKSEKYPFVLGQGKMIPGFEDQIAGMKEKEEKEIEVTFPKEYHANNLAGKKAKFIIKLHEVNEINLPEINDEFATKIGPFKDLPKLKEDIEKELMNTKVIQEKNRVESEILEKISEKINIPLPEGLVHQEIHRLIHEAEHNLSQQGLTIEKYYEATKKTKEDLENELKPEAEKRVKIGLVLSEVAKEIKTEVTDKQVHDEIHRRLDKVREEEKKQAEIFYDSEEGHKQIENLLIGEKVIAYLYESCTIS